MPDSKILPPKSENPPKKPAKPQMFKYKNQYYIVTGAPQFYGNFDVQNHHPNTPFVSVQTLQPVYYAARSLKNPEENGDNEISDDTGNLKL